MSSDNEPAWRICRKAVWMYIQNFNNSADAKNLLNQQDHDLHIASGKCFILLMETVMGTHENSKLEDVLAEFKQLEARCYAKTSGGWIRAVRRKLFSTAAADVDDYDRQITLADITVCIVFLTWILHKNSISVSIGAQLLYAIRRAWKSYQQCYTAVLDVYRNVYDLDQNTPRWPPVFKRRQSVTLTPVSNIGGRMLRSATTSFETLRQNSLTNNMMPKDVVRLMTAVSLGYGAFNLAVSFLPSNMVSLSGMLGFSGSRQIGLDALAFAKNGSDVHAPFAWVILTWYNMKGNTDFMFDGPQSRENEFRINESEQLVCNPPKELRNSSLLQYYAGRSCYLKGDLEGSIRAFEIGSAIVDYCVVNMKVMHLHELGFMYTIRLDWVTAYRKFAIIALDELWMRPYHYFMATLCAVAAGETAKAKLIWRWANEWANVRWEHAEQDTLGNFVMDRKPTVANALRTTAGDGGQRHCRLIVYEMLYVKYGVASWPEDTLHAVLTDCGESEEDDNTTRYTKILLTIVCRKALLLGSVDDHRRSLAEIVEHMERERRRDHLYAYSLYELAAEQICYAETIDDGKRTIQKLTDLKGPYNFQYFYEIRCASLQGHAQKLNTR